jgi:hypothetical protein
MHEQEARLETPETRFMDSYQDSWSAPQGELSGRAITIRRKRMLP